MHPEGLVVLSNNVFWICGKRFFQYDTYADESNDEENSNSKQAAATNYPISASINDYLFSLFVVNKKEVRMYDISNGNLQALHNNIFDAMTVNGEITCFRIDRRHRKAYIANNQGYIIVINCQSGVRLKNVTQFLEDRAEIKRM